MATLTIHTVSAIAAKGRPWTFRLECSDPSNNTSKFWYATGRGLNEAIECAWGRIGNTPQYKLIDWTELRAKVAEKLGKGYTYANTPYERMSPGNLAKLTGTQPSLAPTSPPAVTAPIPVAVAPPPVIQAPVASTPPVHVNPSLPPPFGLIKWLKPAKGGAWDALDSNKDKLFGLPLTGGVQMLKDFPAIVCILA